MEDLFDLGRKKNVLRFDLKDSREGFCRRGRGRSFRAEGPKTTTTTTTTTTTKRRGNHQWKVWYRDPEADSIRSRVESSGGCVKLKTVIRRSSARNTFTAESVYLLLNRRSSEIQGTALGKCLRAWTCIYTGPCLRV